MKPDGIVGVGEADDEVVVDVVDVDDQVEDELQLVDVDLEVDKVVLGGAHVLVVDVEGSGAPLPYTQEP